MTRRSPIPPITFPEFITCTFGCAVAFLVIGSVMGVQWFG